MSAARGPGLPLSNTQHGPKAAVCWIVAARAESGSTAGQKGHAPLIVDLLNYRRDGSPFWNRLSLRPVHNAAGLLTHYVGIQSEITRMRELEERLVDMAMDLARLTDG